MVESERGEAAAQEQLSSFLLTKMERKLKDLAGRDNRLALSSLLSW